MSLNYQEIEEVLKTFPKNGIVKYISQNTKNSIVITLFDKINTYNILIDTQDKYNRICIIPQKEKIIDEKLRFSQFLNSQIIGWRIKSIYQYNLSRIIIIEVEYNNQIRKIIAKLWGVGSNIIFVEDDNTILECLKRHPKKGEWPSEEFVLPQTNSQKEYRVRENFSIATINEDIYYYYKNIVDNEAFIDKKRKLLDFTDKEIETLTKQIEQIDKNLTDDKENNYLYYGELLKSNLFNIKRGEKKVKLIDYGLDKEIELEINPEISPKENVEKFFSKYKKIKDGKIKWEEQKTLAIEKLENYKEVKIIIEDSDNLPQIEKIEKRLKEGKFGKILENKKNNELKNIIGRTFTLIGGYKAFVSRSAKEADDILRRIAKGNDYWFHIRDYPGSHVIVKEIKHKEITEEVKKEACLLALHYSKCKNATDADIYFTRVKYLQKGKTGVPGLVMPTQEKNIKVKFDKEKLQEILGRDS